MHSSTFPRPSKSDYLVKIPCIGGHQTGKTNILSRLCYDYYSALNSATLGIDFFIHTYTLSSKCLRVQFWDIEVSPKSESSSMRDFCLRGAIGVLYVYSVVDASSFEYIRALLDATQAPPSNGTGTNQMNGNGQGGDANLLKVLIANKIDMNQESKVSRENGENLAKNYGMVFVEVSAKDCSGIAELSSEIGLGIMKIIKRHE